MLFRSPAPIDETSYLVRSHHVRPLRSKEEYRQSRKD